MQSQQLMWQSRTRELLTSSKQQPGSLPRKHPVGIAADIAVIVLAALSFSLVLGYGVLNAMIARSGYAGMELRKEIEDRRAESALLRYQIHLAESNGSVHQSAARLGLRPCSPTEEVDYVRLPSPGPESTKLTAADPGARRGGLATAVADFAAEEIFAAGGRAEASTAGGHRQ
jgi:hypothetical protein